MTARWLSFREHFPVRATEGVHRTHQNRPSRQDQRPWHHYSNLRQNGKVQQEWLYTPFLVPIAPRADAETSPDKAVQQYSEDPHALTTKFSV